MANISTDNAEHYIWGQHCDGWHLLKTERLSVIQECVPMGCSEVRHYHQKSRTVFLYFSRASHLLNWMERNTPS